jgi:hypothetical protein
VRFAERPGTDGQLAAAGFDGGTAEFQDNHGRPPTPVEALHLALQATLETRDAKHEPRSPTRRSGRSGKSSASTRLSQRWSTRAEQRTTWLKEVAAVLNQVAMVLIDPVVELSILEQRLEPSVQTGEGR